MTRKTWLGLVSFLALLTAAPAQYPGWQHSGSLYILTTPEGANLPAAAVEENFPLLVRLTKDNFDFSQAKAQGEDVRFADSTGQPLAYQVEDWDTSNGTACVWVRIPAIKGQARQQIKMYWGKADATNEFSGSVVFNEANGFVSVWHMNEPVQDEVGTLNSTNVRTTATAGMIGPARHLGGGQGIFCGEQITNYPSGADAHSTEAWFRAEQPNSTIIGWGNEGGNQGSKVRMQFRSPPHVHIDSDFSDVEGASTLPMGAWLHVAHTYGRGTGKLYINGRLDGSATPTLNIKNPARLWLGGWYNNYDFIGDLDEVRISKVARSADWIKLEYENQKPLQTLVGALVPPGSAFQVLPSQAFVAEGQSVTFAAKAGGAQKVYWVLKRDGRETVAAVDRLSFTFPAGRVVGDKALVLQLRAVYARETKTRDIPITIREDIPEPVFTVKAPAKWNGREPIEVVPVIANLAQMQAKGAGQLKYAWTVAGLAVIKETAPGKLILKRAQNSGPLIVTLALSNGGAEIVHTATLTVTEPAKDKWVERIPGKDEKPEDNQFYARDDKNEGTLYYNGTLNEAADAVFLRVYAGAQLYKDDSRKLAADKAYAFAVRLKPGLIKYKVEFGSRAGGRDTVLHTVTNLVCGDAYLIDGQSNALATDTGEQAPPYDSAWIRSYGTTAGDPQNARMKLWGNAVWKDRQGEKLQLGYWGMELAKRLVESQKIPICIINGAVGGTLIEMHQRSPAEPTDVATIYGRMLWRVQQARLTHGIRGVLWHQGENNQGAAGASGRYGWETYQQYFVDMSAAWKEDFPNLQYYYVFQIWPNACSMGGTDASDMLREVQRDLPALYAHLSVMSTLGIKPPGGCHYPLPGWGEFARLISPLMERDLYGKAVTGSITPPNLTRAYYTNFKKEELVLEFDQPVVWTDALASQFYLEGAKENVAAGSVSGNLLKLKLSAPSTAQKVTYLKDRAWNPDNLLTGANGIAALTFCQVPIMTVKPVR